MSYSDEEIYLAAVSTATLMVFLAGVVGFAIFKYQQRLQIHLREIAEMKAAYESELLRSQLEMQEQTLQTVGRELHDNLGQVLSLMKINLNTLPDGLEGKTAEKLGRTKDLLNRAIADLRGLSKSLNAENRLKAGLPTAIGHELDAVRKTGVVDVTLGVRGTEQRLDPRQELILFRIVQETLNNALKHAQAKNIAVSLEYSVGALNLTVADDGVGFDLAQVLPPTGGEQGSGLSNIQNRARLIGAEARIRSAAGQGTVTTLSIPISHPTA
mgnify:CR=1 FL=1